MLRPVSGRKESKVMLTEATSEGARGDIPSPYCSIDRLTRRCCTAACDCRHHLYDVCQLIVSGSNCWFAQSSKARGRGAGACGVWQAERERRKDDLRTNSELVAKMTKTKTSGGALRTVVRFLSPAADTAGLFHRHVLCPRCKR